MGIFRRSSTRDKSAETDGRAPSEPTPESAVQPAEPSEVQDPVAPDRNLVDDDTSGKEPAKDLGELGEVVSVVGDYRKGLDREGEAVNNFVQDLREHVEQVASKRGKLEEDARELGELCDKLEQETTEVSALRSQIEERVSRINELLDRYRPEQRGA